jgi:negative regulator of sigma E activity
MTGKIQDQISAFNDDELSPDECEFLVRRLERDPESREKALRYAVIGAALRGDLLGPDPDVLRNRLRQALDGVSLVPRRTTGSPDLATRMIRPVLGAGIAATVAAVGLLALNNFASIDGRDAAPLLAAQQIAAGDRMGQAPSYVVPQDSAVTLGVAESVIQQPILLTNYLVRHGEYAVGLGRTSIHSSVVSGQDTWRVTDQAPAEE